MVTKDNEAARFNAGKPMYSYIDFRLWADTFDGKDNYISVLDADRKVCLNNILFIVSAITGTQDKSIHRLELQKLKFLVYRLALMYKNAPLTSFEHLDLIAFEEMSRVLEFGAKKYSRDNWRKGYSNKFSTADSLLRHVHALVKDEEFDSESGLHHIGHIMCNVMFLTNDLLYVERESDGSISTV